MFPGPMTPEATIITHPSMFLPDGVNCNMPPPLSNVKSYVATVGAYTDRRRWKKSLLPAADFIHGRQTLADRRLPARRPDDE